MRERIHHILVALDQLAWVLLTLGRGYPDETISAAAWRLEQQGRRSGRILRPLIDWMFSPLEKDHCRGAYDNEMARGHLGQVYRQGGRNG